MSLGTRQGMCADGLNGPLKGAAAGAAAWLAMDQVLRFLYDREDPEVSRQEDEARGGVPALERMGESLPRLTGIPLSIEERQRAGTFLQWTVGIGAGALYGVLRNRLPGSGIYRGVLYGAAFSLLFDEGAIPLLGFSPGPLAFPWQMHARGFAGHLAFGAVAEVAMEWLDRMG